MEWLLLWLALAIVVGVAANTRGRTGFGWFCLAVVISPVIAGLLVLALPWQEAGQSVGPQNFQPKVVDGKLTGMWRTCPHCESRMSATAPVCATCHRESTPRTQAELKQMLQQARAKTAHSSRIGAIVVLAIFVVFIVLFVYASNQR
jgi:hypothetical protein